MQVIVALGSRVNPALEAARMLCEETGKEVAVFNARFVKPLPEEQLLALAASQPFMLIAEENALPGGFGSAVLELLADRDALAGLRIKRVGVPDHFVEHGSQRNSAPNLVSIGTGFWRPCAPCFASTASRPSER